jgi:lipopolysaccharide export system permease protein
MIYYNIASKLNFYYSDLKNKLSSDNKYLAMVIDSGLWIKDEINSKTYIINSELINKNILSNTIINEFDDNFDLLRTIQSEKIDISQNQWVILNPFITKDNVTSRNEPKIILKTNFNEQTINNLFSNISTLGILNILDLMDSYKKIGYSTDDLYLQILKLSITPLFYGILTVLSSIIMFNISINKPLILHIALGILISVFIYYINFLFGSLGSSGKIPIITSVIFPIIILSIISIIGLVDLNEK